MASGGGQITIGYSADLLTRPAQADAHLGAEQAAQTLGVNVLWAHAYPAEAQQKAIENILSRGIDVLAVDPNDSHAIGTVVKQANSDDVPVLTFIGRNLGGGDTVSFIAANERKGAHDLAAWLFKNKLHGNGQVALIQGDKAQQAGAEREQGIRDALTEFPGVKLVAYGAADWDAAKADQLAQNMLTQHPDIDAILTVYDGMATGVAAAVRDAQSDALITGFDGECPTLAAIWKGDITATLDENWRNIGAVVMKTAVDIARGKKVPATITTPSYVMDKQAMQQIINGTYTDQSPILKQHITAAVNGCHGLGGD